MLIKLFPHKIILITLIPSLLSLRLAEINGEERAHTARTLPRWGRRALENRAQKQNQVQGLGQVVEVTGGHVTEELWDDERGFTSQKGT